MQTNGGIDNEFYMYGSSYGATLAYTAYKFDPFLVNMRKVIVFLNLFLVFGNFVGSLHTGISFKWKL